MSAIAIDLTVCREKIAELLSQVCSGVGNAELGAALQGLLAAPAHVRAAAVVALLDVPAFAEGTSCLPVLLQHAMQLAAVLLNGNVRAAAAAAAASAVLSSLSTQATS